MTIVALEDLPARGVGAPLPPAPEGPGFLDALGPALQTGSDVVAPFYSEHSLFRPYDARGPAMDFDPLDDIAGYEHSAEIFLHARTPEGHAAIRRELDRRRQADRLMDAAGWKGVAAQFLAGALSPTSLLPGGAIVRSARGGVSIGQTAASSARAGALAASVSETALAASQSSYRTEDVLMGISGSALLSGVLGAGVGYAASKWARDGLANPRQPPEAEASNAAAADQLRADAVDRMRAAGADEASARATGDELAEFYRAAATRSGNTVDEMLERFPPEEAAGAVARVADGEAGPAPAKLDGSNNGALADVEAEVDAANDAMRAAEREFDEALRAAVDADETHTRKADLDRLEAARDAARAKHRAALDRLSDAVFGPIDEASAAASSLDAEIERLQGETEASRAEWERATNEAASRGQLDDPAVASRVNELYARRQETADALRAATLKRDRMELGLRPPQASLDAFGVASPQELQAAWRRGVEDFETALRDPGDNAGAMAVRPSDPESEALISSAGAARVAKFIDDPVARLQQSPSVTARRLVTELAESALRQRKNADGETTTADSVQTRMRKWDGRLYRVIKRLDREYLLHRGMKPARGDAMAEAKVVWTIGADKLRRPGDGALTYAQFKQAVGDAMRADDDHAIPEVARAAKFARETLFNPARDDAIELGILDSEVATAADADRYLTRSYRIDRIVRERNAFVEVVADWLEDQQLVKAGLQERAIGVVEEVRQARDDLSKAEGRQKAAARRIERIEVAVAEQALAGRRADRRADTLAERQSAVDEEIADIQAQIDELRALGKAEGEEVRALEREAAQLRQAKRRATPTERQLDAAETEEARSFIDSDPVVHDAFRIIAGRRRAPKLRTIIDDLSEFGVRDEGGELAALGVTNATRPGLLRRRGLSLRDQVGERLTEMGYVGVDPREVVDGRDTILEWVRQTLAGEPVISPRADAHDIAVAEYVGLLKEAAGRVGADLSKPADFHRFVAGLDRPEGGARISIDDLDRELDEMAAAGADPVEPLSDASKRAQSRRDSLRRLRESVRGHLDRARYLGGRKQRRRLSESENAIEGRVQRSRSEVLADRLARAEEHAEAMARLVGERQSALDAARTRAEDVVLEWDGHRSADAKSAIRARQKAEQARADRMAAQGRDTGDAKRLTSADKAVETALRRIVDSQQDLERSELVDVAEQIASRITATADGRLPYDRIEGSDGGYAPRESKVARGPQRHRVFAISDDYVGRNGVRFDAFLDNDIEMIAHQYARTMAPDIELARRFGAPEETHGEHLIPQLRSVELEYQRLTQATDDPKELARLERQRQGDLRAIRGIRDRLRGTYALPANPLGWAYRTTNVLLNFNLIRLLGGVTLASIPDIGHAIAHSGFRRSGLGSALKAMTSADARLAIGDDLRAWGTAADLVLGGRMQAIADLSMQFHRLSRFERGLQGFTAAFGRVSLMSYWNTTAKTLSGMLTMARLAPAVRDLAAGRVDPKDAAKLASVGIDGPMAERIAEGLDRFGEDVGGVVLPNLERWDDSAAADHLGGVLAAEADRMIVTPGMEKPLFASQQSMRLIMQFRSFTTSAATRITASSLQQRDAQALFGVIVMIGLGAISYAVRQQLAGREVSDDWATILKEGVDRSGVLAVIGDAHNVLEKTTGLGITMAIGGPQSSRYYSRNSIGALLGPTAGTVGDIALALGMARAIGDDDLAPHQVRALRRLVPLQNLFWLRWAFDHVQERGVKAT